MRRTFLISWPTQLGLMITHTLALSILIGCDSEGDRRAELIGGEAHTLEDMMMIDESERLQDMNNMALDMLPPAPAPEPARGGPLTGVTSRGHWDGRRESVRFDGVTCFAPSPDHPIIWMSDTFSGTIRRLMIETGEVTTVMGRPYELGVVDGSTEEARFESPRGCAVSSASSALGPALWIADSSTLRRVRLDETGQEALSVKTVAGRAGVQGSTDGVGDEARLGYLIHDIAVSPTGDALYLADRSNNSVRQVTFEGQEGQEEQARVSILATGFDGPGGLAWRETELLVADTFNGRLTSVNIDTGEVNTLAQGLSDPQGVATFGGEAWVAGFDGLIWRVSLFNGESEPIIGSLADSSSVDGEGDEVRLGGTFASIRYYALGDSAGRLLYMDMGTGALRGVELGPVSAQTLAGPTFVGAYREGSLTKARFGRLFDVVGASTGSERAITWYVSDPTNAAVRVIDESEGTVKTLAGGLQMSELRDGSLDEATTPAPSGLAYDPLTRSLYIADFEVHVIRRVDLDEGQIYTIAGVKGQRGSLDGGLGEGLLDTPLGLELSPAGILYIVDGGQGTLRALDLSTGELSTRSEPIAGLWDVVITDEGVLYGSDEFEATLLRLDQVTGRWDVVAGSPGLTGPADGPNGLLARPMGLSMGEGGIVLIADADNSSVRSFDPSTGSLSTFAGSTSRPGGQGGYSLVPWGELSLYEPSAVMWDQESGRGGVVCDAALYSLWSEEVQVEEPPPPPPPLSELPVGDFEVKLSSHPEVFTPLSDGDAVTLHRGCQGAQHVWVGLSVEGLSAEPISFELTLRDSAHVLTRLYLEGEAWEQSNNGSFDLIGLTLVVFDAEEAIGRPLVLGVEVRSADGEVGYGWREVIVAWGADSCGG